MKRLVFLFSAIALLVGCDKLDEVSEPIHNTTQGGGVPEIVYATAADEDEEDSKTRTFINDENYVLWHNGDAISYFTGENHNYKYTNTSEDGATKATFEVETNGDSSTNVEGTYALYPYSEGVSYSDGKFNVTYPAQQTYAENSFGKGANLMVAASSTPNDTDLYFLNAGGCLVIKLYGEGVSVKSIKLTPLNNVKISGAATLTTDNEGVPAVTMGSSATSVITLDCSQYNGGSGVALGATAEKATEFWLALPPTTLSGGFKIAVIDTQNRTFIKQTTKSIAIERAKVQPMAALEFTNNTQVFYTTTDGTKLNISNPFDVDMSSHTYENGQGIITLKAPPTAINKDGFKDTNLRTITLPESVTTIGSYAFSECELDEITIPDSVTEIGSYAFFLSKVKSVNLGNGVRTIGDAAFVACSLKSITIPASVTKIGEESFRACISLSSVDIKGGETTIGNRAFYRCSGLTSVTLGNGVKTLGKEVFYECKALKSISISASVTYIDVDSFLYCTSLSSVDIAESDTPLKIGYQTVSGTSYGPFYDSPLSNIAVRRNMVLVDENGAEFTATAWRHGIFANEYYNDSNLTTTVQIGDKVTNISKYMFSCVRMQTIAIPGSVTKIDDYAFYYCTNLKSATLGDGVQTLGKGVFYDCTALNSIGISASVTDIGVDSFYNCTGLSSVDIAASDTPLKIGYQYILGGAQRFGPFYDSPLSNIAVRRNMVLVNENGAEFTATAWRHGMFANKHYDDSNLTTKVRIGDKVTNISKYMFSGVRMETVWIPGGVTNIGYRAFYNCKLLYEVTIDAHTPPTLGEYAFENCPLYDIAVMPSEGDSILKAYQNSSSWQPYKSLLCVSNPGN